MNNFLSTFSKLLLIFLICFQTTSAQQIIKTKLGLVTGQLNGEIQTFKGIPFAEPPVGELRWKAPVPAKAWKGIKDCSKFSASPMQAEPKPFACWSEEFIAPPSPLSEDCLYLNVWTKKTSSKVKKPVLVWIYGGGFVSGSAACAIYDGTEYAKQDVVFVSINYRVGALGFMAHPELTKEQNGTSGNYGILDQIEALKWVKKNISAFGGDPANVTICGQSAGSMSVNALIASPLANGLFQKAIAQSGGILGSNLASELPQAEKNGMVLQEKLAKKSIAELRNISAEEIQKISQQMGRWGVNFDGTVLPQDLKAYFTAGKQNQTPLLQGWVKGDAGLLVNNMAKAADFKKKIEDKYKTNAEEFFNVFPSTTDAESAVSQTKLGLLQFPIFANHLLAKYNSKPTYMYQIDFIPTDKPGFPNFGAFHTSEVPMAFHNLHTWNRPWQKRDLEMENLISTYWLNFIKTGNPNASSLSGWKTYDAENQYIMFIDEEQSLQSNTYQKEIAIIEKLGF